MANRLAPSLLLLAVLTPYAAQAAFITTHESELEAIFAFNGLTLDVRYLPASTLPDPSFLMLDEEKQFAALLALPVPPSPTISLLFTDEVNFCGGVSDASLVGCAEEPGYRGAVESVFAASNLGDELVAHEIGHMFGLPHIGDFTRLMNPSILGGKVLTAGETATILASPLIQNDGVDFIEILPIVVVPEPGTGLLVAAGGIVLGLRRRRPGSATRRRSD